MRGEDRGAAICRAARALREYRSCVRTSIPFFRALLEDPDFVSGDYTTGYLDEGRMERLTTSERFDDVAVIAAAVAALERDHRANPRADGGGRGSRWKWSLR